MACLRCEQEVALGTSTTADSARGNSGFAAVFCQKHNVQQRRGRESDSLGWWTEGDWPQKLRAIERNEKINHGESDLAGDPSNGADGAVGPAGADGNGADSNTEGNAEGSADGSAEGNADGDADGNGDGDGNDAPGADVNLDTSLPEKTADQAKREEVEAKLDEVYGESYKDTQLEHERKRREEAEKKAKEVEEKASAPTPPSTIKVERDDGDGDVSLDDKHFMFPLALDLLSAGYIPYLCGPAGSGKTTIAAQLASAIYGSEDKFYFCGKLDSAFELLGFRTVDGKSTVRTALADAWDNGGLFLYDEIDRSDSKAVVAFNSATANGVLNFPDGIRAMHPETRLMASGNTAGGGIDRLQQYVTAEPQDASSLDRFQFVPFPYDNLLTAKLAGVTGKTLERFAADQPTPEFFDADVKNGDKKCLDSTVNSYVSDVHDWIAKIREINSRHLIGPRAAIVGANLLRRGYRRDWVEKMCVWKALESAQVQKISGHDRMVELETSIGLRRVAEGA